MLVTITEHQMTMMRLFDNISVFMNGGKVVVVSA